MKERVEKQLESLRGQREMLLANLNGVEGAIAVLERLLKPESETPAAADPSLPNAAPAAS